MRKICVSLSKGGVAKSTSAVSIAHGLSMKGKKTLLIDTDDQGQDSYLLGVKPSFGLADLLREEITIEKAIFPARNNLFLLAGDKSLSGIKRSIGRKDISPEKTLSNALSCIEGMFDFIIIDTSPSWDTLTINSLFYCTEVLTPVSLEILSLNSLIQFRKKLDEVMKVHPNLQYKYLLPTFSDGRVKKSKEILDILHTHYPQIICEPIRYCSRISEAHGFGKTIFEYAPNSRGSTDYKTLIEKVLS